MAVKVLEARIAPEGPGIVRRVLVGFFYFLVLALAIVGIAELGLEGYAWHSGARWRPEDINIIFSYDSPAMRAARAFWAHLEYFIQYGAYFIAAVALFIAVTQIKTLARLMSDFLDARGAIYQLAATMTNAEQTARRLSEQANRLSVLEPTIKAMSEKVEETVLKIGDLQRSTVSERTDEAVEEQVAAPANGIPAAVVDDDDSNWARLRELWNANGARLDEVIERIKDKRVRTKYSRMDRRNYPAIINGLAADGFISESVKKASLDLHATFQSYKPRNRKIPDQVVSALTVLDALLSKELAPKVPEDA